MIVEDEICRHVARLFEMRYAYRIGVRKSEVKKKFGRPRRRWENNIKIDLAQDVDR
jgi:hypothetical protein